MQIWRHGLLALEGYNSNMELGRRNETKAAKAEANIARYQLADAKEKVELQVMLAIKGKVSNA